jgi:HD-like signal output (HDOD) protein/CheY-like chemotaxis protein
VSKVRVVFVDDEERVLDGLRDRLRRHRAEWDMAFFRGAEPALAELARAPADVVVTDMRMPRMDGAAFLERVRQRSPQTVRIILSGFTEMESALRTVPVAHQFLCKPSPAGELENSIERALSLRSLLGDEALRRAVGRVEKLPSPPRIYARLVDALASSDTSARRVAAIVAEDTAMCARILQLVNSAFFGLPRTFSGMEQAVAYLGFDTIKGLVLSADVFRPERAVAGLSIEEQQLHALHVGRLAAAFAEKTRFAANAFIAGLLHDIGALVLVARALERPSSSRTLVASGGSPTQKLDAVVAEPNASHAEVGAYLLGLWNLPYPIVEAVAHHHQPTRVAHRELELLSVVYVAEALAYDPDAPVDEDYLTSVAALDRLPTWRQRARAIPVP